MSDDMFNLFDDQDPNEGGQAPTPSALRQFAEATQKENKELKERLAALEADARRSSLANALSEAGKDPAAVSLIPADVTNADGVAKWLEANGALIKDKEAPAPEAGQEQQRQETQQVLSDEDAKKLAAVSGAPDGSIPPTVQSPELDNLRQAESREDFYERLRAAQKQHP